MSSTKIIRRSSITRLNAMNTRPISIHSFTSDHLKSRSDSELNDNENLTPRLTLLPTKPKPKAKPKPKPKPKKHKHKSRQNKKQKRKTRKTRSASNNSKQISSQLLLLPDIIEEYEISKTSKISKISQIKSYPLKPTKAPQKCLTPNMLSPRSPRTPRTPLTPRAPRAPRQKRIKHNSNYRSSSTSSSTSNSQMKHRQKKQKKLKNLKTLKNLKNPKKHSNRRSKNNFQYTRQRKRSHSSSNLYTTTTTNSKVKTNESPSVDIYIDDTAITNSHYKTTVQLQHQQKQKRKQKQQKQKQQQEINFKQQLFEQKEQSTYSRFHKLKHQLTKLNLSNKIIKFSSEPPDPDPQSGRKQQPKPKIDTPAIKQKHPGFVETEEMKDFYHDVLSFSKDPFITISPVNRKNSNSISRSCSHDTPIGSAAAATRLQLRATHSGSSGAAPTQLKNQNSLPNLKTGSALFRPSNLDLPCELSGHRSSSFNSSNSNSHSHEGNTNGYKEIENKQTKPKRTTIIIRGAHGGQPLKQGWFWVDKKGITQGPVSLRRLKLLYALKELKDHHYVWNGTTVNEWTPLKDISYIYNEIVVYSTRYYQAARAAATQNTNCNSKLMAEGLPATIPILKIGGTNSSNYNGNNNDNDHKCNDNDNNESNDKLFNWQGYPIEMFMDISPKSKTNRDVQDLQQFVCTLCHKICRNCVEINCKYGHLFCQYCISEYIRAAKTKDIVQTEPEQTGQCPECSQTNVEFHISQYVRRKIDELNCKCLNFSLGCKWLQGQGMVCKLRAHLLDDCDYTELSCNGCSQQFQRKYFDQHIKVCDEYQIECHQCKKQILRKHLEYPHLNCDCELQIIQCTNYPLCTQNIYRKDLNKHLKFECNQRIIKCPYAKLGCNNKTLKADRLSQHLNEYIVKHNQLQFMYMELIANANKYIYVSGVDEEYADYMRYSSDNQQLMSDEVKENGVAVIDDEDEFITPPPLGVDSVAAHIASRRRHKRANFYRGGGGGAGGQTKSYSINGLYQRLSTVDVGSSTSSDNLRDNIVCMELHDCGVGNCNEIELSPSPGLHAFSPNCSMKAIYKKRSNGEMKMRFNFDCKKWCFMNKQREILILQANKSGRSPCNISRWKLNLRSQPSSYADVNVKVEEKKLLTLSRIHLSGFNDLFLFRRVNYLEACDYIRVSGRHNINEDMNGVYRKQCDLHCGRCWYLKVNESGEVCEPRRCNNRWVIRYLANSELWVFDKRGLRNDDIANAIGRGDVLSPLLVRNWEIHTGKTFIVDDHVKLVRHAI